MAVGDSKQKGQESLSGKTKVITLGLVIAVIGSIIAGSFEKDTLTNYTGFAMMLTGLGVFILGIFATAASALRLRLCQDTPTGIRVKPKMMYLSVWSIGMGVMLAVVGSVLASAFEKDTLINAGGFGMLLSGICIFVLGFFGTMLATLGGRIDTTRAGGTPGEKKPKVQRPRYLFSSILSMGIGTTLTVVGSIIGRTFAKETIMNYAGFGVLLVGIAIMSLGISGTVVAILKNRWDLGVKSAGAQQPHVVLGSIWAIGIGSMLVVVGSLLAGSYAKSTLMNYAGFGMLLAGTGVFLYGVFETARVSTMGFLNRKRNRNGVKVPPNVHVEELEFRKKGQIGKRFRRTGRNLVSSSAILNLVGVMAALGLLFFSLWQLDMIVSGPVWWSGGGTGWSHANGAYANDPFQCFLWKTTIGQAYDTLFMLIFISFIILFASAFFWPRTRGIEAESTI